MRGEIESAEGGMPLWDIDFSSALENRTGKYFIGRDIILDHRALIRRVYYWRRALPDPEGGLGTRLLRLGLKLETRSRGMFGGSPVPPRRASGPTLHLDPFSVLHSVLHSKDIVLVHDLGPLTDPDLFQPWLERLYRAAYRKIVETRARTVFVSGASRDAFEALFGATPGMTVIYPHIRCGIRHQDQQPVAKLSGPYLLTVGSLGRRKNQLATIRAFAQSGLAARGFSFVLCGAREPGADAVERAAVATPGVRLLPYVSDAELTWLYSNAAGFVLVSRLEGFGMPVAEAISHGMVPLVTQSSVLEEVAGRGALTASASDEQGIAAGMIHLAMMSAAERRRRVEALRLSVHRFTAEGFAESWRRELSLQP